MNVENLSEKFEHSKHCKMYMKESFHTKLNPT